MRASIYQELRDCLAAEKLVALTSLVVVPENSDLRIGQQMLVYPDGTCRGDLGDPDLDSAAVERLVELFAALRSERCQLASATGPVDVFLEVYPPRPQLIIVGAVHVAMALVGIVKLLGFRTWVVDPRTAFATRERFPHADELVSEWPDEALRQIALNENTYVALLSHDLKLDLPALAATLAAPVRYIGALGSKKTHGKRVAALREKGFADELIARVHNPIGLDLGGRRAEDIALAIAAEMQAVSHGRVLVPGKP